MTAGPVRPTAPIDLGDVHDSRVLAIGRIPANSRVLDLRVGDGSVARILTTMGCQVWGIAPDPDVADQVREVCASLVEADLDAVDLIEMAGDQKFDIVLLLGVLERLSDPAGLLDALPKLLDETGWAVVTLPNVAHASIRMDLLRGHFDQSGSGLLAREQLRFFDRRGVDDLLGEAGWQILDLVRVVKALDRSELQADAVDSELVARLESDVEALTHQFVLAIAPQGSPVLTDRPAFPAAAAQNALIEALGAIRELDEEVRRLQRQHLPDLMEQLEQIRDRVFERKAKLKEILAAVRDPDRMSMP